MRTTVKSVNLPGSRKKTEVERLADFVAGIRFEDLSHEAVKALKARILDSLGCAIGALGAEPMGYIRQQVDEFGGRPLANLIGGGATSPDRAAFYNGALVRYLDFNDSFLARGETCHPSDNLGAVLAACDYADGGGKDLLVALGVAYAVQCRLSEVAPVRHKGFDHTTQGAFAAAAGVARALGLDPSRTAHAIAISGTSNLALRVTRTGRLSHWKGLAYPAMAANATHAAFLASRGITGPLEVFEGNKGFKEAIAGPFDVDWSTEDLDLVLRTCLKRFNAEVHSQSALEALLELRAERGLSGAEVERIEVDTFDVAFHIIGGGEEGEKAHVITKEEADHSLPYLLAVALLDGEVSPRQYAPERIGRDDVQRLLRQVAVRPDPEFSNRFPGEMPARLRVYLNDGTVLVKEKSDYEGFSTRPMACERIAEKFDRLAAPHTGAAHRNQLVAMVADLENRRVRDLTERLAEAGKGERAREDPCHGILPPQPSRH